MVPRKQLDISREWANTMGGEAKRACETGRYSSKKGTIDIAAEVEASVRKTVSYPPEASLPDRCQGQHKTIVEVHNETTRSGVRDLLASGYLPVALNFAAATSPGGGFLTGARAQEEYMARSTSLYACLRGNEIYEFHNAKLDPFYTDYVIYSPDVVVFRNDDGEFLDVPYTCSIITAPAVHASGVQKYCPQRLDEIELAMWNRLLKVLAVAVRHGHESLVLGAWGCGAFKNDPNMIARSHRRAFEDNFRGVFKRIRFSVADWSNERRFIGPFEKELGAAFASHEETHDADRPN